MPKDSGFYAYLESMRQAGILAAYVRERIYLPTSEISHDETAVDDLIAGGTQSPKVAKAIADCVDNLLEEIRQEVDQSSGLITAKQADALENLALLIEDLPPELFPPDGPTFGVLTRFARDWKEIDPEDTIHGDMYDLLVVALINLQREGMPQGFWRELWEDLERSELWGLGFQGLVEVAPEDALSELPTLLKRISQSAPRLSAELVEGEEPELYQSLTDLLYELFKKFSKRENGYDKFGAAIAGVKGVSQMIGPTTIVTLSLLWRGVEPRDVDRIARATLVASIRE